MYKKLILATAMALLCSTQVRADLFWDGAPGDAGQQVAQAASEFTSGVASFYNAISAWEKRVSDGRSLSADERSERSNAEFSDFINSINSSRETLSKISGSVLDQEIKLDSEQSVSLDKFKAISILKNNGYSPPTTYRDIISIAQSECGRILEISGDAEQWAGNIIVKRELSLNISRQLRNSLDVGLVLSIFSDSLNRQ